MADANKLVITGNLCRDPRVFELAGGRLMATFMIASNRYWQSANGEKKNEVCFVGVTCFAKMAEKIREYAVKGTRVWVEGRLKLDSWDDKETGQKRSRHSISADFVLIMSGRGTGKSIRPEASQGRGRAPMRERDVPDGPLPPPDDDIRDEDIPDV